MIDGKTLVRIWCDQQGRVHGDFFFDEMDRITALKVNLRLDQIKGEVLATFEQDFGLPPEEGPESTEVPGG